MAGENGHGNGRSEDAATREAGNGAVEEEAPARVGSGEEPTGRSGE